MNLDIKHSGGSLNYFDGERTFAYIFFHLEIRIALYFLSQFSLTQSTWYTCYAIVNRASLCSYSCILVIPTVMHMTSSWLITRLAKVVGILPYTVDWKTIAVPHQRCNDKYTQHISYRLYTISSYSFIFLSCFLSCFLSSTFSLPINGPHFIWIRFV